ncbi:DUF1345 domain-containing protein [Ramlibacter sp. AN1133]|uniref:DUF1345 domain-containing protein n=1 Tax=Ramlibacter sp. AN1133 TaxID=3133429 RepID=UPI0030BF3734
MASTRPPSLHPRSLGAALRARPRLVASAAVGAVLFGALRAVLPATNASIALLAWNAGALLYLGLAWHAMTGAHVQALRKRAVQEDEGRLAILLLVVLAALAVLLAVGSQLAQVKNLHGPARALHTALAALTVLTSWLFTQVLFAQHYAHDFYAARVHGGVDPLLFPGTPEPGYGDFFHFACVIGTSAQTADISFNGSGLRGVGTLHCIVAFFFNATLLALSINIAAALLL